MKSKRIRGGHDHTLWGKGTLWGREKGLAKQKPLVGPLTKRKDDLWGKDK